MEFNAAKCEVIHCGRSKRNAEYWVNGRILGSVDEQRDLGVHVHKSLKLAYQLVRNKSKEQRKLQHRTRPFGPSKPAPTVLPPSELKPSTQRTKKITAN